MSADRELLELAANAAGLYVKHEVVNADDDLVGLRVKPHRQAGRNSSFTWNPLANDGDALRLAVKLGIQVWRRPSGVEGVHKGSVLTNPQTEPLTPCPYAATRRAIVRAAAEIQKLKLATHTGDPQ